MPATATPPAAAPAEKHFAFAFELTGSRNENMLCPVDQHVCRGRWEAKNLQHALPDPGFSELPTLPGLTFIVNTRKREVRRFDPLILPQNAVLLRLAQKAMAKITHAPPPTPERGRLWTDCDPDFVKTVIYWWWKLAGCKRAKIVGTDPGTGQLRGVWPASLEDIRLIPGLVMGNVFSSSGNERGTIPNDKLKWRPPTDDDFVREETLDDIPDPFVDVPTDPREYLDRPAAPTGYTRVTGGGGRSAADVLMADPLAGGGEAGPEYAPTL